MLFIERGEGEKNNRREKRKKEVEKWTKRFQRGIHMAAETGEWGPRLGFLFFYLDEWRAPRLVDGGWTPNRWCQVRVAVTARRARRRSAWERSMDRWLTLRWGRRCAQSSRRPWERLRRGARTVDCAHVESAGAGGGLVSGG